MTHIISQTTLMASVIIHATAAPFLLLSTIKPVCYLHQAILHRLLAFILPTKHQLPVHVSAISVLLMMPCIAFPAVVKICFQSLFTTALINLLHHQVRTLMVDQRKSQDLLHHSPPMALSPI